MPDFTRRQLVMLKLESTYAVDAAPNHTSSGDTIRLVDAPTLDLGGEIIEFTGGNFTRGRIRPVQTVRPFGVTFRAYVQGLDGVSYTSANKPPLSPAFQVCGLQELFVTSNAVGRPMYSYVPTADVSSDKSGTVVVNVDGYDHRAVGCRGNVNFIYAAAAPVVAEFNLRGILTTETTTVRGVPTGLPTATPQRWIDSGTIIVGSVMPNVANFQWATGNTVYEQRSSNASSASGIGAVYLTERAPAGSFDPEVSDSIDFVAIWRSSSGSVLRLNVGLQQGLQFTVTASQMIPKTLNRGDTGGLIIFNVGHEMVEKNGDDQFVIQMS